MLLKETDCVVPKILLNPVDKILGVTITINIFVEETKAAERESETFNTVGHMARMILCYKFTFG